MIRVLIADDHEVIRAGVRSILSDRQDLELHEASDGAATVAKALRIKPDVVILDLTMPVMSGYDAAVELRRLMPEVAVLFFSIHNSPQLIKEAQRIGARGFVNKADAANALLDAIEELVVHQGTFFLDSRPTPALRFAAAAVPK